MSFAAWSGLSSTSDLNPASTEAFFRQDEAILDRDLARLDETAQEIGAAYWVVSTDDFSSAKMKATETELREERASVESLL